MENPVMIFAAQSTDNTIVVTPQQLAPQLKFDQRIYLFRDTFRPLIISGRQFVAQTLFIKAVRRHSFMPELPTYSTYDVPIGVPIDEEWATTITRLGF